MTADRDDPETHCLSTDRSPSPLPEPSPWKPTCRPRPHARPAGRLRGVIFDMDGVLVDVRAAAGARRRRGCSPRRGTTVRHEEFRPFIGMGEDRFIGGVAEARGIPIDPERDKARTYALYLDLIKGRLEPLPGVRRLRRRVPPARA